MGRPRNPSFTVVFNDLLSGYALYALEGSDRYYFVYPNPNVEHSYWHSYSGGDLLVAVSEEEDSPQNEAFLRKRLDGDKPSYRIGRFSIPADRWKDAVRFLTGAKNPSFADAYLPWLVRRLPELTDSAARRVLSENGELIGWTARIGKEETIRKLFNLGSVILAEPAFLFFDTIRNRTDLENPGLALDALTPHIRAYLSNHPDDPRTDTVRSFLQRDVWDGYPKSAQKKLIVRYGGIGLPPENVVNHHMEQADPDGLFRYLRESEPGCRYLIESRTPTYFAFILGYIAEQGSPEMAKELAECLISLTKDADIYHYLSAYLGEERVAELAAEHRIRGVTFDGTPISWEDLHSGKNLFSNIPLYRILTSAGACALCSIPNAVRQVYERNPDSVKKEARDEVKGSYDSLGSVDSDKWCVFMATAGDAFSLKYVQEGRLDYLFDRDYLFALSIRLARILGKRIHFATPYGTEEHT